MCSLVDSNTRNISTRLRDLRQAQGWKQKDAAERAGLSQTAICDIERAGDGSMLPPAAEKYAAIFGLELHGVVEYELRPASPAKRRRPRAA
jgi:transcriptional regulator with XRE-family HTH domain